MNIQELLQAVEPLTAEQRLQAEAQARVLVAGRKPERASKYPPKLERNIKLAMYVLLALVFGASAIKVYTAASSTFNESINSTLLSAFVGVAFVGASEIGQLVLMLMLPQAPDRSTRMGLWAGIVLCTAIPLVANSHVAGNPIWSIGAPDYLWKVLATYSMPFLSLLGANVLKVIEVNRLLAQEQWKQSYDLAHESSKWRQAQAQAFRDVYQQVNKRRKVGAVLNSMQAREWLPLVERELRANDWSAVLASTTQPAPAQAPSRIAPVAQHQVVAPVQAPARSTSNGTAPKQSTSMNRPDRGGNPSNGVLADATYHESEHGFNPECPECGIVLTPSTGGKAYSTMRSAEKALAAHQSKHPRKHKEAQADEEETEEVVTVGAGD